jgi:hypothetical protein
MFGFSILALVSRCAIWPSRRAVTDFPDELYLLNVRLYFCFWLILNADTPLLAFIRSSVRAQVDGVKPLSDCRECSELLIRKNL